MKIASLLVGWFVILATSCVASDDALLAPFPVSGLGHPAGSLLLDNDAQGKIQVSGVSPFKVTPIAPEFSNGVRQAFEARYPFSDTVSLLWDSGILSTGTPVNGPTHTQVPALLSLAWEPWSEASLHPMLGLGTGGIYTNSFYAGRTSWTLRSANEISGGLRYRLSDHSGLGVTSSFLKTPYQNSVIQNFLLDYSFRF